MKVLLLGVVGLLGFSLAGAQNVTKCSLKSQLKEKIDNLPEKIKQAGLTADTFVAKLVCYVENGSNFSTSAVTELSHDRGSPASGPSRKRRDTLDLLSNGDEKKNATLYGLFQLPGDPVCNDNNSPNVCGMDCRRLTDDKIDDDIHCVLTLIAKIVEQGFGAQNIQELTKVFRLMMQPQCKNAHYDVYFHECH
ncbi:alpha-lactalbumin [Nothobranchius furzeri]|uniref:lysozyme n=1 Tax=Nothobranchius furzeri TaxID=105023 RepID=A0A1A7ZAM8_NOTFU|nr:alpha-lactalbumin-like [Nothobranchius furzeri]